MSWLQLALCLAAAAAAALAGAIGYVLHMPGSSYRGPLPPLDATGTRDAGRLRADVEHLAGTIGPRHLARGDSMERTARYLEAELAAAGWPTRRETFTAGAVPVSNLVAERPGTRAPGEILVIGAHYDTCGEQPGADDNASGVAGLLGLARTLGPDPLGRTVRLVAFANEEPPWFKGPAMGSRVHAAGCRARGETLVGMWSLEMLGYYTDLPGTQDYPWPVGYFFPSEGNFLGFVSDWASRALTQASIGAFRRSVRFPSEGLAAPVPVPGIDLSDHWSFWQEGYPAVMVVDGGPYRNPHYHMLSDRPETLDYDRMARVVQGLAGMVRELGR